MPSLDNRGATPRRDLHVFYVLDTSGSMEGNPIQILNQAMLETIGVLKKVAKSNGDAQLKLSVLEFGSMVRWMQKDGPQKVEDFVWQDLSAGGLTANTDITFTNSKGGTLPTGLFDGSSPLKWMMALAALMILIFAALMVRKYRRSREEE